MKTFKSEQPESAPFTKSVVESLNIIVEEINKLEAKVAELEEKLGKILLQKGLKKLFEESDKL